MLGVAAGLGGGLPVVVGGRLLVVGEVLGLDSAAVAADGLVDGGLVTHDNDAVEAEVLGLVGQLDGGGGLQEGAPKLEDREPLPEDADDELGHPGAVELDDGAERLLGELVAHGSAEGVDEVFVPHLLRRKNLQHGDLAVGLEEGSESWNTVKISW